MYTLHAINYHTAGTGPCRAAQMGEGEEERWIFSCLNRMGKAKVVLFLALQAINFSQKREGLTFSRPAT